VDRSVSPSAAAQDICYLKDWHHVAEYPEYGAYETPHFFEDDWLNWHHDIEQERASKKHQEDGLMGGDGSRREGAEVERADYRFVYLGPAGSFTALHSV
jgi:hypothetical protein